MSEVIPAQRDKLDKKSDFPAVNVLGKQSVKKGPIVGSLPHLIRDQLK